LALFSLVALLLAAPLLHLDLSALVLCLVSVACAFMSLRAFNMLRLAYRIRETANRYSAESGDIAALPLKWRHVIVVPIYKETVKTIGNTIRTLSRHRSAASSYVVVCAHEQTDPAHDKKFHQIHEEFAGRFLDFVKSVHVILPRECPGKASNVNCAVRDYATSQSRNAFASTMVTVIDCDTKVHEHYFWELERAASTVHDPHAAVFAAPTFFESNRNEVPCFVRAADDLWSMAAAANIFANSKMGFPISNYSLSLRMLDEMDYWDVDHDSVGEDFHTFVKASAMLDRAVRLVPIAVPMNNRNVEGHTYKRSLLARYAQSLRHASGIPTTAYLLRHVLKAPFSCRKWVLLLLCFEAHYFPLLYFTGGIYAAACRVLGDFFSYFHDEKLTLFVVVTGGLAAVGNLCFTAYKAVQFYLRRRVFREPLDAIRDFYADARDVCVQALCVLAYFVVPFGFRVFQDLALWTNKVYDYNELEERERTY
jgi:hypothetical protein